MGEKASRAIPVGFYFALLSRSLEFGLRSDSMVKLQDQIASLLHIAQVEDFLHLQIGTESISPSKELAAMRSIFATHVSYKVDTNHTPSATNSTIAELWDTFLIQVASDLEMGPQSFMELIETVPISYRLNHDLLYRAMNSFLQAHKDISQEERAMVCKHLNCQKLSQETCIEAVQNELMPLRLIVQALFVQQLNTHQAFRECSDSFRYTGPFSGSLPSSRCPNTKSLTLGESPYTDGVKEGSSKPLSFLLQNELAIDKCDFSRKEYESTSFRIQNLEKELMSLKRTLQLDTERDALVLSILLLKEDMPADY